MEHSDGPVDLAWRERAERLSGIVDTAMDAIITTDATQRVVVFNRAACRMFRVSAKEAIGGTIDPFIPIAQRVRHAALVHQFAAEGTTSRRMGETHALTGRRADGEIFPIEASISRAGTGASVLMTVVVRDMTALRQAEKDRLDRAAADASNAAKTVFLAHMGHELRTPLNAVLGLAQLILADTTSPVAGDPRRRVELIVQAGEHLLALIEQMLDVSGIDAGRVTLVREDLDLGALVDAAMQLCEPQAQAGGVVLAWSAPPDDEVIVHADGGRLRQVMLNLLSNAIKYNRRGGRVRVGLEHDGNRVTVTVRDDGLGMTERQRTALFEPFNRLGRENSTVPGTGIGLVLVRRLVALLGGEFGIDSRIGEGTVARVSLPLRRP